MFKLEVRLRDVTWSFVQQDDGGEIEGKGIQNGGETSYAVSSRDTGDKERT